MRGRRWSDGSIALRMTISAPSLEKGKALYDYLGGVCDTLDGSHGFQFTYLPVVFQDDCQICDAECLFKPNSTTKYVLEIEFLE